MMQTAWRTRALVAANFLLLTIPLRAQDTATNHSQTYRTILDHNFPRLVLVMTFDQFRADLLTRFSDQFLPAYGLSGQPGGFRWLMENGAVMADAHYAHDSLHTGPGHATILTGACPRDTGIVNNSWYTTAGLSINCVEDRDVETLGLPDNPNRRGSSSPKNLLAETVGDELKLSNNRLSKVIGLSLKDRAAILPTGHSADAAVWFDRKYGKFVSSTWYGDKLPEFAQLANDSKLADRWLGATWDLLLAPDAYKISMPEGMNGVGSGRGLPSTFPKILSKPGKPADSDYYAHLIYTPYANEMLFDTAKLAIQYEHLGQDIYPDILSVSFSTTDIAGHNWGPHSRELQDIMLRADRQMADFLGTVDSAIPGGLDNVTIVLTGDHGGAGLPEWLQEMKFDAGRVMYDDIIHEAEAALADAFPGKKTKGLVKLSDPNLMFVHPKLEQEGIDLEAASEVVAKRLSHIKGVRAAYTHKQIQTGQLPRTRIAQAISEGYNPDRSGDIILVSDPFYYNSRGKTGSTHGTPYNYDNQVPLIFVGKYIKPGVYTKRVDVRDIAPTLSFFLGIGAPASSNGNILSDIIK